LKDRLARRGVGVVGVAAALLWHEAVAACLPPALVSSTAQSGTLYGLGQAAGAGAVSPEVVALTQGVLKAMSFEKIKTFVAVLLTVSLVALGGGLIARHATAEQPGENAAPKPFTHRAPPPRNEAAGADNGGGPREYKQRFIK